MDQLKIECLPLSKLKPYNRNARKHSKEDVQIIANSIKDFGFNDPIGVWGKENLIVEGHGRYMAAEMLGMTEVPCVRLDHLTDEQRRAYALAHNKTAEMSEWDEAIKSLELLNISDIDMLQFGFSDFESNNDLEHEQQEKEKIIESMSLKAFEHYDYIVFVFNNTFDWLNVVNEFGIKKVDAGYGATKKIGIGRVVDGARLLEKIRHQDIDSEQRASGNNSKENM